MDGAYSTARNRGAHDVQWDWRRAGGSPYDQDIARGGGYGRDYGAGRSGRYDREFGTFRATGGGWFPSSRPGYGRPDRYDVSYRGWNGGVGYEPGSRGATSAAGDAAEKNGNLTQSRRDAEGLPRALRLRVSA